jgi:iron complex outermembrane receptor protein
MKDFYRLIVLLLISSGFSTFYGQVDTTEYEMEEIMVTGTRVEQKIIDIPYSVQRIDQSAWVASRKLGLNDVLTTIPGLFLQSRYGNHDVRVTIRGFGSRSNTGIRGVRILLDGIPESEPDGQTRIEAIDFTSIGRIEIVKGNSSSLYTNAPGGVINFLTDKYFLRSFVLSENEFGSFDTWKNGIKVGVNSTDTRFMVTGSYENYGGFRNHSSQYMNRLNAIYEANVTDKSKLSLYGYYVNTLIKLPGSLTLEQYTQNDTAANPNSLSRDENRFTEKGRLGVTYNANIDSKNMNHAFEVTGYGTIKYFNRVAKTYRIFNRFGLGGSFRYINKYKLSDRTNEFSVGGDLFVQTGPISEFKNIGGRKSDELVNLNDETISNVGFYFVENFPIIRDRLALLVTGRYDRVKFSSEYQLGDYQDTSRLFDKFTPKFALNLKLNPKLALYGSFGLGFDSPAGNEMDNFPFSSDYGLHLLNPDLKAQKSMNYEFGIKGDLPSLNKRIFINNFIEFVVYHNRIEDVIVPFTVDTDVFYRNAATSKRTGIELGINSEVVKGLTLKAAYTFSDFKYDEYSALNIDSTGAFHYENYNGNVEPSNPKNLFSGELTYRYTLKKNYTFFIKGNYQYVGEMFVNDSNSDSLKTEAYNLINGQIGVDIMLGHFKILAYGGVNNLADKKYVAFININSNKGEYYESGAPRNFFGGLSLAYMFGKY